MDRRMCFIKNEHCLIMQKTDRRRRKPCREEGGRGTGKVGGESESVRRRPEVELVVHWCDREWTRETSLKPVCEWLCVLLSSNHGLHSQQSPFKAQEGLPTSAQEETQGVWDCCIIIYHCCCCHSFTTSLLFWLCSICTFLCFCCQNSCVCWCTQRREVLPLVYTWQWRGFTFCSLLSCLYSFRAASITSHWCVWWSFHHCSRLQTLRQYERCEL